MTDPEQVYTVVEPPTSELVEKAALNARQHTQRIGAGFMELLLESDDKRLTYGIFKIAAIIYAASAVRPHSIEGTALLESEPPAVELVIDLPDDPSEPAVARLHTPYEQE